MYGLGATAFGPATGTRVATGSGADTLRRMGWIAQAPAPVLKVKPVATPKPAPRPRPSPKPPVAGPTLPPGTVMPDSPVYPPPGGNTIPGGGSAPGAPAQSPVGAAAGGGGGGWFDADTGAPAAVQTASVLGRLGDSPLLLLGIAGVVTYFVFGKKGR